MKTISATSQKGQHFIWAYAHSNMFSIYDAYKKPSKAKIRAYSVGRQYPKRIGQATLR